LIDRLEIEILNSKDKIILLEQNRLDYKKEVYKETNTELDELLEKRKKLIEENTKLKLKTDSGSKRKSAENRIEIRKLDKEIKEKQSNVDSVDSELKDLKIEEMEKSENITALKKSVDNIKKINKSTDLLALISVDGKLSSSNLESFKKDIQTITEEYQ